LDAEIEDVGEIDSLRQVREMFTQFRTIYLKMSKKVRDSVSYERQLQREDSKEV
jgi:hypothetical protein